MQASDGEDATFFCTCHGQHGTTAKNALIITRPIMIPRHGAVRAMILEGNRSFSASAGSFSVFSGSSNLCRETMFFFCFSSHFLFDIFEVFEKFLHNYYIDDELMTFLLFSFSSPLEWSGA